MLRTILWDYSFMQLLQILQVHVNAAYFLLQNVPKLFRRIQILCLGRPLKNTELILMSMKRGKMVHYHAGKRTLVLVLTITPAAAAWNADTRQIGFMDSCYVKCQILTLFFVCLSGKENWSDQATFLSTLHCPVLVSLCPLQPQIPVPGWQKWNLMWSSAV